MSKLQAEGSLSNKVSTDAGNKRFYIEGVLTDSSTIDREDEIVDADAFPDMIRQIDEREKEGRPTPLLIEHRRQAWPLPVGAVTKAWQDGSKLRFRGYVVDSPIGKEIQELIKSRVLYGVSIGGDPLRRYAKYDNERGKDIGHINKVLLDEVSLTGLPVQPQSIFKMAKSLNTSKSKIEKAIGRLDAAITLMKATNVVDEISEKHEGEKSPKLSSEEVDRLKGSLEDIALLMGVKLKEGEGKEAPEAEDREPDIPAPPEYREDKDKDLEGQKAQSRSGETEGEDPEDSAGHKEVPHASKKHKRTERYCPDCDFTLDADAVDYDVNFCPKCGREFVERYASNMSKRTCERCSYEADLDEDADADGRLNFCPRCGEKFEDETKENKDMAKVKKSKKAKEELKKAKMAEEEMDADLEAEAEGEEEEAAEKKPKAKKGNKAEEKGEEDADLDAEKEDEEEEEGEEGSDSDVDADADEDSEEDADADAGDEEEEEGSEDEEDADADDDSDEDEDSEEDADADDDSDEDEDEDDADADDDSDEDEDSEEDADADAGDEEEEKEGMADWAKPDLDEEGRPMYRCADCDAMYDIDDEAVQEEHCEKCMDIAKSLKHAQKAIKAMKSAGFSTKQIAKALGSIAVAPSPKGSDTHEEAPETYDQKKDAAHSGPKGDDIAVAPSPKGAQTKYTTKARLLSKLLKNMGIDYPAAEKDRPGADMADFGKNFRDGSRSSKGGKAEGTDEDMWVGTKPGDNAVKGEHSSLRPFGKDFVQAAGDHKVTVPLNYGINKSLKRLAKLAKSIAPLAEKVDRMEKALSSYSSLKKSKIAGGTEKSAQAGEVRETVDREFAARLLGKLK